MKTRCLKKTVSLLLCLLMVGTCMGLSAFAAHAPNTLTYDANGGQGAPASCTVDDVYATIDETQPVREGYFFTGWNTQADGTGADYYGGYLYAFSYDEGNGGCETTLYAQWLCLYVGDVLVTEENAGDILGDGRVSYDVAANTLTLKNLNLSTGYEYGTGCVACIYAEGDLNLCLEGENALEAPSATESSDGIYVKGDLTIAGSGTLTATGGLVSGVIGDAENDTVESTGVAVGGDLTVSGVTVTATGGDVEAAAASDWNGTTYAYSNGIYVYGDLVVEEEASVRAFGGKATAVKAYSRAIEAYESVHIQNAAVEVVAGEAVGVLGHCTEQTRGTSVGLFVENELSVMENGKLEAVAGRACGTTANSHAIQVFDGMAVIEGGSVTALGGEAVGSLQGDATQSYASSAAFYAETGLQIGYEGALVATGGKANGTLAYSQGIYSYGYIGMHDGYLAATGSDAVGEVRAESNGIYVHGAGFYTYENGGNVLLISGSAKGGQKAFSNAINVYGGDVGIEGGSISVVSGSWEAPQGDGYGIYVKAEKDEEGDLFGGYVTITANEISVNPNGYGFITTKVDISTANGDAIYGYYGIELGEMLTITSPEQALVAGQGEMDQYGDYEYYTVVDAQGNAAKSLSVALLTYKIKIENNRSYEQGVPVPAGWSANQTYCEKFAVEDMVEILQGERDGFRFDGFYTDEACTDGCEYDFDTPVTEDMTIYAKWTALDAPGTDDIGNSVPSTDGSAVDNTDNGENAPVVLWIVVAVLGCAGIAVAVYFLKKRKA